MVRRIAQDAAEDGLVEVAVTPKHGSVRPAGKSWLGGEYSSLIFGARVEIERVARNFTSDVGAHSTPVFQLLVWPIVE